MILCESINVTSFYTKNLFTHGISFSPGITVVIIIES